MNVKIERVRNTVIATLPAEAVKPDARLRANLVELMDARDIKALLIDLAEIREMTDELVSLILAIQHQAGLRNLKVIYFSLAQEVSNFLAESGVSGILDISRTRVEALRPFL